MPSPRKVSPSPSFSDSISSVNWRSISGRLAVVRLAHEFHRLRPGGLRRDALRLERLLELAPLRIGERALAGSADRLRARLRIAYRLALDQGIEDAQEIRLAAVVCFTVPLDQPSA